MVDAATRGTPLIEKTTIAREMQRQGFRIPLLIGEDGIHGHSFWKDANIFPTQLAMAASWSPDLLERVGRVDEAREWMRKAAVSDIDGVTDAEERVEEAEGLAFSEEELEDEPDTSEVD